MRRQIEEMWENLSGSVLSTRSLYRKRKAEGSGDQPQEAAFRLRYVSLPGHSEPKAFAVGLRIEHPQSMINQDLYGEPENKILGSASYKVTHTCENGRGVYSFCMCPGGYVVNASSEQGLLAVNGMSYQARDGENANSALIVTVTPKDFPEEGALGGIAFQRDLEKSLGTWKGKGSGTAFQGFLRISQAANWEIHPNIKGGYVLTDVRSILPKSLGSIEEGIFCLWEKASGFDRKDAVLSGKESRTSSPVRLVRDQKGLSNITSIYPLRRGRGICRRDHFRSHGRNKNHRVDRI